MQIDILSNLTLSPVRREDVSALVENLNDEKIYENTFSIPFPYRHQDAKKWITDVEQMTQQHGQPLTLAIRLDNKLIGGIGLLGIQRPHQHRAELGYWLAPPYWGRGWMTKIVGEYASQAFDAFQLMKLTANVFEGNNASERVLEKCGFQKEGFLRSHLCKDGKMINVTAYGLLKP